LRIATLSHFYDPEPGNRVYSLARELVACGHQVTSLTGFPNFPQGKLYPGYRLRPWQVEHRDGVRVVRMPLYPSHDRSSVRRSANFLSFTLTASILGPYFSGPIDLLWVYHPPLTIGIPASWIGFLRRAPFVYEVQDMWPETVAATGMLTSPLAIALLSALARFIYARATAITVISPGFRQNLIAKGVPAEKIHVIPNWADEDVYRPVARDPELARRHGLEGRFNVVYGGTLGAAQELGSVLQAAMRLRDLQHLQFVFIGDGVEEQALRAEAARYDINNVRFLGRQPAAAMPGFYSHADALLMHLKRDPLFEITIPSKTVAYLASGRPIICAVAGDAAQVIESTGAGIVCPPEDIEALAGAVRQMVSLSPEQRATMGEAGRRAFLANYTRRALVERYKALFAEVVHQRQCRNVPSR
jgi:glycosyltransferase involved in cell wall biosynthesis